ncbi:hypothetical protein D9M73_70750 [compost metagenome]
MHEPPFQVFAWTGVVAAALGPVLGPFALLLFAAVMGGLLSMSTSTTTTRWEGFKFLAVGVGISFVLTGAAVWAVERYTNVPGNIAFMPVAFFIAAGRSKLMGLIDLAIGAVGALLTIWANRKSDQQKGGGQ